MNENDWLLVYQNKPTPEKTGGVIDHTDRQIGGEHYKSLVIQPSEYIVRNGLGWYEGNVIKYVTRHKSKGGKQDLEKALHYLQLAIQELYE